MTIRIMKLCGEMQLFLIKVKHFSKKLYNHFQVSFIILVEKKTTLSTLISSLDSIKILSGTSLEIYSTKDVGNGFSFV